MMRPAEHLRNGKLCRADQAERDVLIVERFVAGETYAELCAAFLVSQGTIWAAIKRQGVRLPSSKYHRGKTHGPSGQFVTQLKVAK